MLYSANYPDILIGNLDINPSIYSPNADYCIQFALTKEQKYDYEEYEAILKSAINGFRKSNTYRHYKSYLYSLGLDCCQFHPYMQATDDHDIANLEMHHCMLNIYDIAILITEHTLNTYGSITEFDLDDLLRLEHSENNIPIVMLCKDCHVKYHHKFLYVHPDMIFGQWWNLLYKYPLGLTREIMEKIVRYLEWSIGEKFEYRVKNMERLLALRDSLANWSDTTKELIQHGHERGFGQSRHNEGNNIQGKDESKITIAEYVNEIRGLGG